MKHKKLFVAITAVCSVLLALTVFLTIWYWGDNYSDFKDFRQEVEIPGLKDGGTPQGLTSLNAEYTVIDASGYESTFKQDYYFISQFYKNAPTRIYVVGKTTGYGGYVTLKHEDGTDYTGQANGIATNGLTLWVSSDRTVYTAKRNASSSYKNVGEEIIKKAALNLDGAKKENGSAVTANDTAITFTSSFNTNCEASFLYFYDDTSASNDDKLYVGGFYRNGSHDDDKSHLVKTPSGDENCSIVFQYDVLTQTSSTNVTGLTCINTDYIQATIANVPKIDYAFSIPAKIQGFARTNKGKLVLSQSYGLGNSHLLYYDWAKVFTSPNRKLYNDESVFKQDFKYEGVKAASGAPYSDRNLYVYFIDSAKLVRDYSIPSMAKGLCVTDSASDFEGRVNVIFESGSKSRKLLARQSLTEVYSFAPKSK